MKIQELIKIDFKKLPDEIIFALYREVHTEISKRRNSRVFVDQKINHLNSLINKFKKQGRSDMHRFKLFEQVDNDDWSEIYSEKGGESKYYVYMHIEPVRKGERKLNLNGTLVKGLPFYVGKGTGDRAYDLKRNEGHGAKLKELLNMGISANNIVVIFRDNLTESQALCLEAKLIYFFGTKFNSAGGNLVNLTAPKTPYD